MLYAIYLLDRSDAGDIRTRVRTEHRAYLGERAEQIAFAGPLLSEDGQAMAGSLLVMEFASREDVDGWLRQEPYTRAGLYERVSVHPFMNRWPQKVGFVAP